MNLANLEEPMQPANADNTFEMEIWKMEWREYAEKLRNRHKNSHRVMAIVLGQCLQALCNRLEADPIWDTINANSDAIALLELVQRCMNQCQTRQYEVHTLIDAKTDLPHFKQLQYMSNSDYFDRFKDKIGTITRLNSTLGAHPHRVEDILQEDAADPDIPTDAERQAAVDKAQDQYFASRFLLNSDSRRYGGLVRDVVNEFTRDRDTDRGL